MRQSDIDQANVIARGVTEALSNTAITVTVKSDVSDVLSVVECSQVVKKYCESHEHRCGECLLYCNDTCALRSYPRFWDV